MNVKNITNELICKNRRLEVSDKCVDVQIKSQMRELAIQNRKMHLFTDRFLGVLSTLYIINILQRKWPGKC